MKIEFRDVVKSYGGHRALDGLTLTAPSGAVYGLVGPNGAGKTTAMKHLAGVLRQDSGEVLADARRCTRTRPSRRAYSASRTRYSTFRRRPSWT